MKSFVRPIFSLLAVLALACQAAPPDPQNPATSPSAPAPATRAAAPAAAPKPADPLVEWVNAFFPWGVGQTTLEEITTIRLPGARIYVAKRTFDTTADQVSKELSEALKA